MIIVADLCTFLSTGVLGSLRLGASRQEVLKILGSPNDWTDSDRGVDLFNAWAFYYPDVTLFFEDETIETINVGLEDRGEYSVIRWTGVTPLSLRDPARFKEYVIRAGVALLPLPEDPTSGVLDAVFRTVGNVFVCAGTHIETAVLTDGSLENYATPIRVTALVARKPTPSAAERWRQSRKGR